MVSPIVKEPLRVAIVGSGVSGLAALWALNRSGHEVHIFEAQDYIGGHAHTVEWKYDETGTSTMVDMAFALFNEATYPNFVSFLSHLGIKTRSIRVTFGVTRNRGEFEWSSRSMSGVFAQRQNVFSPSVWRMCFDIVRFNTFATDILDPSCSFRSDSLGDYLRRNRYSKSFVQNYINPLTATIWAIDPKLNYFFNPAIMVIRYLWNHHLLNTFKSGLRWQMIKGGAIQYVNAILAQIPRERVHVSTKVARVHNKDRAVVLVFEDGHEEYFDRVVIATHGPQALQLIEKTCTPEEKEILQSFKTSQSSIVLHSDLSFMPRNRAAWSAWNYLNDEPTTSDAFGPVSLTFNLTDQPSPDAGETTGHILCTLNPPRQPDPAAVRGTYWYSHPLYDITVLAQQARISNIQGTRNIWYAGAWMKYGFHEDGFTAGLEAARSICPDIKLPFKVVDSTYSRGLAAAPPSWATRVLRLVLAFVQFWIVLFTVLVPAMWVSLCRSKLTSQAPQKGLDDDDAKDF